MSCRSPFCIKLALGTRIQIFKAMPMIHDASVVNKAQRNGYHMRRMLHIQRCRFSFSPSIRFPARPSNMPVYYCTLHICLYSLHVHVRPISFLFLFLLSCFRFDRPLCECACHNTIYTVLWYGVATQIYISLRIVVNVCVFAHVRVNVCSTHIE